MSMEWQRSNFPWTFWVSASVSLNIQLWVSFARFCCRIISVAKPELTIDTGKYHETKPIRVGENLALACPFKNFDNFKWFKGEKLFNDQSRDIHIFNSSTLHAGKVITSQKRWQAREISTSFFLFKFSRKFHVSRRKRGRIKWVYVWNCHLFTTDWDHSKRV